MKIPDKFKTTIKDYPAMGLVTISNNHLGGWELRWGLDNVYYTGVSDGFLKNRIKDGRIIIRDDLFNRYMENLRKE